jgi:hypothetical protein
LGWFEFMNRPIRYQHTPLPSDDDEEGRIRRSRLFEAMMRGGASAYNREWDRLFPDPRPMRRIDAHDVGDVLWLKYPIPESEVDMGFYVLTSVLGDDAFVSLAGEDENGELVVTDLSCVVDRKVLDWFQFVGVNLGNN